MLCLFIDLKMKLLDTYDQVILFTALNTWYQNNFNLTRRSRTLAKGERLLLTYTNFLNFHRLFYPSHHMNLRS